MTGTGAALFGLATLLVLVPLPARGADVAPPPIPVVDLHVDLSYRVNYRGGTLARGSGQYVASRLLRAGVRGVVLPLFVPKSVSPEGPRMEDLEGSFEKLSSLLPKTPPFSAPGCRGDPAAVRTFLAFEGAGPLAGEPTAVERWAGRGVRVFGLVHTFDNALATSSANETPSVTGLTDAGRDVVRRVFAAGGIVDVSHASDRTTDEILALARAEGKVVVATHSNARALTPHPRNLEDDQIRAIAATGGVVGVNFHSRFLVEKGRATIADVVRHVRHLVSVAGVEHVAIGSDFEGDITPPVGLEDASRFPALGRALVAAGLSREDVTRIFGENALRVLCPNAAPLKK
ncbi:MAG TPA: membrane dipeptidase [Polyangiaceae bacterium]|nr:membrane dipeptidase [Polyangiaceae bacterium]